MTTDAAMQLLFIRQVYGNGAVRSDMTVIYICLDFELVIIYIMTSRGGAYDEG